MPAQVPHLCPQVSKRRPLLRHALPQRADLAVEVPQGPSAFEMSSHHPIDSGSFCLHSLERARTSLHLRLEIVKLDIHPKPAKGAPLHTPSMRDFEAVVHSMRLS